jgi:hypothetical protein
VCDGQAEEHGCSFVRCGLDVKDAAGQYGAFTHTEDAERAALTRLWCNIDLLWIETGPIILDDDVHTLRLMPKDNTDTRCALRVLQDIL